MKNKILTVMLACVCLVSCNKTKASEDEIIEGTVVEENVVNETVENVFVPDPEIQKHIDFSGGHTSFVVYKTDLYILPDLTNYGEFDEILFFDINSLDLSNLGTCNSNRLSLAGVPMNLIILSNICENIEYIDLWRCDFDRVDFLYSFPNLKEIYFHSKVSCIPDLSNNKKLEWITIRESDYYENKELFDKIKETYPDIKFVLSVPGEL